MDLIEQTRIVIAMLNGAEPKPLARELSLDSEDLDAWTRTFLEAGIAALAQSHPAGRPLATVIPFPDPETPRAQRRS